MLFPLYKKSLFFLKRKFNAPEVNFHSEIRIDEFNIC